MSKATEKVNTKPARTIEVLCGGTCAASTEHEVVASLDTYGTVESGPHSTNWNQDFQIVRCKGCRNVSFREASWTEHDVVRVGYGDDDWEVQAAEHLYPPRLPGRKGLGTHADLLPSTVLLIYQETVAAHSNSQPVLTAIGLRALVEAVCGERNASGGRLVDQIDSLKEQRILTPAAAQILHKIRTLGNAAAHEVRPHTPEQLNVALDVVEHLLKDVYILPAITRKAFDTTEDEESEL